MAKKRLSAVTKVTTAEDNDYIVMNTSDGKTVQINLNALTRLLFNGISIAGYESAEGGLYWSTCKYIGLSGGDGAETVLLISPYQSRDTKEKWRGCIEKFFFTRGSTDAGLISEFADVTIAKAYNGLKGYCQTSWYGVKLGYCNYGGLLYLALRFPLCSFFGITFSGKYSGNCVFKSLPFSSINEWVEL